MDKYVKSTRDFSSQPSSITGTILADFAMVATEKERPTDKDALVLYFLPDSAMIPGVDDP